MRVIILEAKKEGAEDVTEKDLEKVIDKSEEIKKKFRTRGPLSRFMDDVRLLVSAVKDYPSGAYRQIPYAVIAAAVFALLYVFNPFDLMPDMLPLIDRPAGRCGGDGRLFGAGRAGSAQV